MSISGNGPRFPKNPCGPNSMSSLLSELPRINILFTLLPWKKPSSIRNCELRGNCISNEVVSFGMNFVAPKMYN